MMIRIRNAASAIFLRDKYLSFHDFEGKMNSILIRNGLLVTMSKYGVISNGAVYIEGNRIRLIGKSKDVEEECSPEKVIDASGMAVLPGLINTHSHLYQSFLRGMVDTAPLVDWCEEVLYPFCRMALEDAIAGDDRLVYYSTLLSCVEALKSGTTTIVAMEGVIQGPAVIRALKNAGIRGVYALTLADKWIRRDIILPTEWALKRSENLIKKYGEKDKISFMLAPSTPFCCSRGLLKKIVDIAGKHGVGIHIHVGETRYEVDNMKQRVGMGSLEYINSLGLLDVHPFVAVHCIWLDDKEIRILKEKNAGVSHNPESNMKLASGIAPIKKMLNLNIPVGLATDGPASNDNLDMFEEMRTAALLHKVSSLDPSIISATDVMMMATKLGAKVLGMDKEIGSIEPGKKADIILVNLMKPHIQPLSDIFRTLVYCAKGSDVDTVIVDGRIVVRHGKLLTIDEEELLRKVMKIAEEKLSKLDEYRKTREPIKESDLQALS